MRQAFRLVASDSKRDERNLMDLLFSFLYLKNATPAITMGIPSMQRISIAKSCEELKMKIGVMKNRIIENRLDVANHLSIIIDI